MKVQLGDVGICEIPDDQFPDTITVRWRGRYFGGSLFSYSGGIPQLQEIAGPIELSDGAVMPLPASEPPLGALDPDLLP